MASFDFIEASMQGHSFVWKYREYLFKVALPVFFVKIACFLAVFVLGLEKAYLHQGLILMPGYFVEAILLARMIRFYMYGEPIFVWGKPVMPPKLEHDIIAYQGRFTRQQCVHGCIALFMIVRVIQAALVGGSMDWSSLQVVENAEQTIPLSAVSKTLFFMAIIGVFIWLFRYLWVYIPMAMGFQPMEFIRKRLDLEASVVMVLLWALCTIPLLMVFGILINMTAGSFLEGSVGRIVLGALFQATGETIIASVQVIAMTEAFKGISGLGKQKK
ncbi:MAG: hypothetical protein GC137_02935 [Alphaproteobacteria bacterium]|nr:hypothetical protein [Alphaproteobacteria bacterium]